MNIDREYASGMDRSGVGSGTSTRGSTPKKGRYLKDPPTPSRRRRRRRRINPRFLILLGVLLVMLIGIAIGMRSCSKPSIRGRWDLDGTTVYEFNKDGKGTLLLMTTEYEFAYTIEKDTVFIDFVDERALDAKYSFKVEDGMLFLTGGPGNAKSKYVLQKLN